MLRAQFDDRWKMASSDVRPDRLVDHQASRSDMARQSGCATMTESEALREWRVKMENFTKAKMELKEATAKLLEPPRNEDKEQRDD